MANPLSLIMPVIPGTSLQTIATALAQYGPGLNEALNSIGTVHYARTLLLDASTPNLQPGAGTEPRYLIAIITEYDGDFNAYIGDFVAKVHDAFDALLQFVIGGPACIPVADNVAAFEAFITLNDASQHEPNTTLFQAYSATVQEIRANLPPAAAAAVGSVT